MIVTRPIPKPKPKPVVITDWIVTVGELDEAVASAVAKIRRDSNDIRSRLGLAIVDYTKGNTQ